MKDNAVQIFQSSLKRKKKKPFLFKSCFLDQVYREVDRTQDVYINSAKDVVESAMAGYNGTLFAYGQTASGKTYTMFGTDNAEGIVQMALDTIFAKILEVNFRQKINETKSNFLYLAK